MGDLVIPHRKKRGIGITEKVWVGQRDQASPEKERGAQNLNATLEQEHSSSSKGDASERDQNGSGV